MPQIKTVLKQVEAFDFLFSKLELQSSLAKRRLLDSQLMTDAEAIEKSLSETEQMITLLGQSEHSNSFAEMQRKLLSIKDVNSALDTLSKGFILDDIELFEVKNFCLTAQSIANLFFTTGSSIINFPKLEPILDILDPDRVRMSNFYIYDSYSQALKSIRADIKQVVKEMDAVPENNVEQHRMHQRHRDDLYRQSVEIEDEIRKKITSHLFQFTDTIRLTLNNIAHLDILIAKAQLAKKYHLTKPSISDETTTYCRLFNPHVQYLLEQNGKKFQAVDIHIPQQPCLIMGANMAGKTVLLKTLCLAQYLFQFGFFVPAERAQICVVDEILTCMEDGQSELKGLSSFAAEILNVNNMLKEAKSGRKPLILIDELAHTTNPVEGSAIINGVLEVLHENKTQSVVTTHFPNISAPCKKLRINGFIEKNISDNITPQNVNDFIDYNLIEDTVEQLPMEALRIAKILGVDNTLIERARKYLNR